MPLSSDEKLDRILSIVENHDKSFNIMIDIMRSTDEGVKRLIELCDREGNGALMEAFNALTTAVRSMSGKIDTLINLERKNGRAI